MDQGPPRSREAGPSRYRDKVPRGSSARVPSRSFEQVPLGLSERATMATKVAKVSPVKAPNLQSGLDSRGANTRPRRACTVKKMVQVKALEDTFVSQKLIPDFFRKNL